MGALALVAWGSDDNEATDTSASGTTAPEEPGDTAAPEAPAGTGADIVAALPASLAGLYDGFGGTVEPSPYSDFAAVDGPWTWCHSESFQGNPWRVAVTNEMERLAAQFGDQIDSFRTVDSNGDVTLQASQIQSFIDDGCSIITMVAGSATGLDPVIEQAFEAGIPVVTLAGGIASEFALNVDSNYRLWGYDMMSAIAAENPEAKVLVVEGIAGNPIVAQQADGVAAALEENPGLEVVATVNGDWSPDVTKQVVLQTLATTPGDIDAVWTSGSESRVVAEAFAEAARPAPLITASLSGDALGYWNENQDNFFFTGNAVLPVPTAATAFRVGVRVLQGQGPTLSTLLVPLPAVTQADLPAWYASCMTPSSGEIFPTPSDDVVSEEEMNAYFVDGAATPPYDWASTEDPCA